MSEDALVETFTSPDAEEVTIDGGFPSGLVRMVTTPLEAFAAELAHIKPGQSWLLLAADAMVIGDRETIAAVALRLELSVTETSDGNFIFARRP